MADLEAPKPKDSDPATTSEPPTSISTTAAGITASATPTAPTASTTTEESTPARDDEEDTQGGAAPAATTATNTAAAAAAAAATTTTVAATEYVGNDNIIEPLPQASGTSSAIRITLLMTSGIRHNMVISKNSLKKRGILSDNDDPFNITVYQLKQIILDDWNTEWLDRPSSPDYIRLIFFGSLLNDTTPLSDTKLKPTEQNVIHMTVKPSEILEDDEKLAKRVNTGRNPGSSSTCCCVVQ